MTPKDFWRLNFENNSSDALDVLRIVASYDKGGTIFEAVCAVSDNPQLQAILLTLLDLVRGHVDVLSYREAARHAVAAIESEEWWPVSAKPNKP